MTAIWTVGDIQEYSNGFHASVEYVDGLFAIMKELPDMYGRIPEMGGGYFIALAEREDRGDGDFPWIYADCSEGEEPRLYSNLVVTIAQMGRVKGMHRE